MNDCIIILNNFMIYSCDNNTLRLRNKWILIMTKILLISTSVVMEVIRSINRHKLNNVSINPREPVPGTNTSSSSVVPRE